jgi:hypothetical protein
MLTFEETLQELHAWLGRDVAVAVNPALVGSMQLQVAMFFGVLTHAEEPPSHIQAALPQGTAEPDLFVFFVGEERRNHFMVSSAYFTSAELQTSRLAESLLAITCRLCASWCCWSRTVRAGAQRHGW